MTWNVLIQLIWFLSIVRCHYEPYGENIASGKPASQSTTYDAYNASLGVDGRTSTKFSDGTCSHTGEGPRYAWWTVDLLGFYFIKFITIYQWTAPSVNRLDGSQMYVKVKGNTWKKIYFNSTWPSSVLNVSLELDKPIDEIMLNNSKMQGEGAFICVCELQAFKVIECLTFPIGNGRIQVLKYGESNQTFTFGTKLIVTCHEGYRMSDDGVLTNETESTLECNASGNWSRNLTCSVIDCGRPSNIPNNSKEIITPGIAGNNTYNATMTVECNEGYHYSLQDKEPLRCASSGLWTGNLGKCNVIDCGRPLNIPDNSTIKSSTGLAGNTSYNTTLTIECNKGFNYTLPGNNTIRCGKEGHWAGNPGLCEVIDCGRPLNIPGNSTIVCSTGLAGNTSYNATCRIQCNNGFTYKLPGNETISCGIEAHWTGTFGLCEVIDCGRPLNIPGNSTVVSSTGLAGNTSYNATYTIHCNNGFNYTLPGNDTIRCDNEGKWTGNLGICKVTHCTEILPPEYGVIVVETGTEGRWSFNTTVAVICNTGYILSGEALIKCLETGRWTIALGYCLALQQMNADEEKSKTSLLAWIITGPLCLILLVTNIATCFRLRRHENSDIEIIKNKTNGSDNNALEPYDNLQMVNRAKSEYDKLKFERESSLKTIMKNETYQNTGPQD